MAEMEKRPWRFTIEFDDEKAKRNGYNVDDLYDCVGKYAEQMGNEQAQAEGDSLLVARSLHCSNREVYP